jgi:hypothetical protein
MYQLPIHSVTNRIINESTTVVTNMVRGNIRVKKLLLSYPWPKVMINSNKYDAMTAKLYIILTICRK